MRNLLWQSDAWKEYESLQAEKALLKKTNKLLKDIMRNGYQCSYGKVEMLKGDFSGYASVRIDQKNRIIFSADEDTVTIIQCGGHYDDK
ncbi:MAG: Txe/YoeB family addiction module toxin [Lachnospiraceae bacterium]|nr:Txe/YoeB family addiction module toxin [Lachnospiraceae bacterium]